MIKILFAALFLVGGVFPAVQFCYDSGVAEVDVFRRLAAVKGVSAVGVMGPHFVEIQGFA